MQNLKKIEWVPLFWFSYFSHGWWGSLGGNPLARLSETWIHTVPSPREQKLEHPGSLSGSALGVSLLTFWNKKPGNDLEPEKEVPSSVCERENCSFARVPAGPGVAQHLTKEPKNPQTISQSLPSQQANCEISSAGAFWFSFSHWESHVYFSLSGNCPSPAGGEKLMEALAHCSKHIEELL